MVGQHLMILLDINDIFWGKRGRRDPDNAAAGCTLSELFDHVLVFLNAFRLLDSRNQFSVYAYGRHSAALLSHYNEREPAADADDKSSVFCANGFRKHFVRQLRKHVAAQLQLQSSPTSQTLSHGSLLSAALSLALCFASKRHRRASAAAESAHRAALLSQTTAGSGGVGSSPSAAASSSSPSPPTLFFGDDELQPRLLVLHASNDVSSQYIAVMNCIFSAQKLRVPIDACVLRRDGADSSLLQQAAHITRGIYARPTHQAGGLLQYLLSIYLSAPSTRAHLQLPVQRNVDFRASCFCHQRTTDMAYVCSVCLSIFCDYLPVCTTCNTRFPVAP
jgi:Transcription factor Tfb4